MKVSKKLLQTMAAGLIFGATLTSCDDDFFKLPFSDCDENCEVDHEHKRDNEHHDYCPACGLG